MAHRFRSVLLIAFALSACDVRKTYSDAIATPPIDPGWHYSWNDELPHIGYGFSNTAGGFYGHCDSRPIFAILGVAHSQNVKTVTVEVDGDIRQFDVNAHYGNDLLFLERLSHAHDTVTNQLDNYEGFAWKLARSRRSITVSTDDRTRWSIPASDGVMRFVQECISVRKAKLSSNI